MQKWQNEVEKEMNATQSEMYLAQSQCHIVGRGTPGGLERYHRNDFGKYDFVGCSMEEPGLAAVKLTNKLIYHHSVS